VAARQAKGKIVLPESVICPRHFWGFMHRIEVPVQQTSKKAQPAAVPAVQSIVEATVPVRIVAGFNDHVKLAADNRTCMAQAATDAKATLTGATKATMPRDAFIQTLKQIEPDLVYLYCHAWPETLQQKSVPHPNLDFGTRLPDDIAFAKNFSGPGWKHRPLVFLNGCGTVGFTPIAPAEFITQFIQGRYASAVIGTEVAVWAELAHEVGWKFCKGFLTGEEAGATLLTIRRQLLHKNNPLGLVYTLYGSAGLHLVKVAPKPGVST
jgi:hypothetical protein